MIKKTFKVSKRLVVTAVLLSALFLGVSFRHSLFRFGVESLLGVYAPHEGGWKFQYKKIGFENKGIVLTGSSIASRDGEVHCEMDRLELVWKKGRRFHLERALKIEHPVISFVKQSQKSPFKGGLEKFLSKVRVDIERGEALFINGEDATKVYFSLASDEKRRWLGTFYLSHKEGMEDDPIGGVQEVMIKAFRWPQEMIIEMELEDASLSWMSKVYAFFKEPGAKAWEVESGILNGHFWLGFKEEGGVSQANAVMHFDQLAGRHEENGLRLSFEELSLDFSYPGGKRGIEEPEIWWQNIALKSQVVGGKLGFKDQKTEIDFSLCDLSGYVNLSTFKDSEILLRGYLDRKGMISPILLSGNPSVANRDTLDFDLKLLLEPDCKESTHLNVSIAMEDTSDWIVRGKLQDMGIEQIAMFQHIMAFTVPEIKDFELSQGKVTCELSVRMHEGRVDKLLLDNLEADNLQVYWASRDILGFCSHLGGSAQLDFNKLPAFQFPSWDVTLKNGDLIIGRNRGDSVSLSDINMQLFVCRDVFEPSWIKATYQGLEMQFDIVGYYPEADIKMNLKTSVDRILAFFAKDKEAIHQFKEHKFCTDVALRRQLGYWDVSGSFKLDVRDEFEDAGEFGFYLSDKIYHKTDEMTPQDLLSKSISKGWFAFPGTCLEFIKCINVCVESPWILEGIASFEGSFDGEKIDFDVETSHIQFFSEFIDLKMNDVSSGLQTSKGTFHYDIRQNRWQGFLPLYHTSLYEKSLGLSFKEGSCHLCIDDEVIRLEGIKTEIDEISLEGDVELNFQDPNGPLLKATAHHFSGNTRQVESLLGRIQKEVVDFKGLDGRCVNGSDGFLLLMDFRDKEPHLEWKVSLSMVHGKYNVTDDLVITDLSFDLDVDSSDKKASLSNIVGRVHSQVYQGGYLINGRYVEFDYYDPFPYLSFDMRLENETMDLIRLKGKYSEETRAIVLDEELTEIFGRRLNKSVIILGTKHEIESCNIALDFSLKEMFSLLEIASDLNPSSIHMEGLLQQYYQYEGEFKGEFLYKAGELNLDVEGKDLQIGESLCEKFRLSVTKLGDVWTINPIVLDEIQMRGKLSKKLSGYDLSEIEVTGPEFIFKCGIGEFDIERGRAFLPIEEAKALLPLFSYGVGVVELKGDLEIGLKEALLDVVVSGDLKVEGKTAEGKSFTLSSDKRALIEYTVEHGLVIKDSAFVLKDEGVDIKLDVPTLAYSFSEKVCQGYRIKAEVDSNSLLLIKKFLPELSLSDEEIPRSSLETTTLTFDFEVTPEKFQIGGTLPKGEYLLKNKSYPIEGCNFHYDEKHLDLCLSMPLFEQKFEIHFKVQPFDAFDSVIEAYSLEKPVFFMQCKLKGPDGFSIQKMEGDLFGLDFSFLPISKMQDEVSLNFLGSVKINADALTPLLGKMAREFVEELKFHKGYELKGELSLVKDNLGQSVFEGYLGGRDFDFLGYQLKTLLANIRIHKQGVEIKGCRMSDDAVTAEIAEIKIALSDKGETLLQIPELRITDLRPSLLRKRFDSYQRLKPFRIKEMLFQDIVGDLNDITTLTGKGHLQFVNTFKQGHNLLDIPIEIISRLGLDIVLLVPIQGEMDYVIRGGKVVFTKLKNSFSENKRSYFYLWNKTESYVDFEGNMHIDIRMKQYVLFKITELFVLSVRGELESPKFSLR